jgi:CRP-like cAMP-binding protein
MSDAGLADLPMLPGDPSDVALLLADMSLFAGMPKGELADFASAFERVELEAGEVLWRQATPVDGLHVIVSGEGQVCRRLPGERELEIARIGPGDVLGEIPLLGGGTHSATVRALTPASLLFLDRSEFTARMHSRQPGALELRRRIVAIACDRLRRLYDGLVAMAVEAGARGPLPPDVAAPGSVGSPPGCEVEPPPLEYVLRLPLFRGLNPELVSALLQVGTTLHVPRGCVIVAEGTRPSAFYVTLNGAVEEVLAHGMSKCRVSFAGPGRAFGFLGLLDGGRATMNAIARERSTILAIGQHDFDTLLRAGEERSRAFAAAVESDLMLSLREAERPMCWRAGAG